LRFLIPKTRMFTNSSPPRGQFVSNMGGGRNISLPGVFQIGPFFYAICFHLFACIKW
jgi:hypothetical protein